MIPDYQSLMRPTLEALQDGEVNRTAELKNKVVARLGLTPEEATQLKPSGKQTVISNRIGWALTSLTNAGLVSHPSHGRLEITPAGTIALQTHDRIDVQTLLTYPEYAEWRAQSSGSGEAPEDLEDAAQLWLVGAMIGKKDVSEEFIAGGYWRISTPSEREREHLRSMAVGDRIAIKAAFVQRHDLPFDNHGRTVSVMRIKARGTITSVGDADRVGVDWEVLDPPRDWYFYTYQRTMWKLPANAMAAALERFIFEDEAQDRDWFLSDPYWGERYGSPAAPQPELVTDENPVLQPDLAYSLDDLIDDGCFVPRAELEAILEALQQQKNVILQGAPGTGKTWLARRLGWVMAGRKSGPEVQVVQFHPNTSYEDFVRGYRPQATEDGHGSLALVDGPFLRLAERAHRDPSANFTMVIEEINRGNPARALGEMLTLLEASKRNEADAIRLTYERATDGDGVWLSDNLYVIGTMNIADRSLAMMDMALRRRFAFFTLQPQFGTAWQDWMNQSIQSTKFIQSVAQHVMELNATIAQDPALGEAFMVGHSFFTPGTAEPVADPRAWFEAQVKTAVAPLLREYWYDRPSTAEKALERLLA